MQKKDGSEVVFEMQSPDEQWNTIINLNLFSNLIIAAEDSQKTYAQPETLISVSKFLQKKPKTNGYG